MDGSSRSLQRGRDEQAHTFGYGDDFPTGEDSNYLSNKEREANRYRRFTDESFALPTANFGGYHLGSEREHGDFDRLEYPRSANIYGERDYYPGPGRSHYQERNLRDQPSGEPREGFWESTKRFFGVGPRGWKRSDERIREDVCEALAHHADIDASDMEVAVRDGVVFLTGTADSRFTKRNAEDVAENVSGVTDVQNELRIQRPEGQESVGPSLQ